MVIGSAPKFAGRNRAKKELRRFMERLLLKRKAYSQMLNWKNEHAPEYALFLKGARRTGKTTLAETFGKKEYRSCITINFQEASSEVKELFENGLMNLNEFFTKLELLYKTKLYRRQSLIILDEIQLFPLARQALKTLLNDKRYDYIETGSLAGITQKAKKENILIPSEEEDLEIHPLDFEEFLWACGDELSSAVIKDHYASNLPFGRALLKNLMDKYRLYMCVGGMPQAVLKYAETKDMAEVDFVKRRIVNLYRNDLKEQNDVSGEYIGNVFDSIPSQLSKHDKRFVLSQIDKNARLANYGNCINWLEEAMVVNVARNVTEVSPALSLSLDDARFKMYLCDTGLLIDLAFDDGGAYFDNEYYKAILLDKLHINEGMFIENLVAQSLRANHHKIRYNAKSDPKSKKVVREVDFLIREGMKVTAIEVKSSDKFTVKSLLDIKKAFNNKIGKQVVLYDGDCKKEDGIFYHPYFMASVM